MPQSMSLTADQHTSSAKRQRSADAGTRNGRLADRSSGQPDFQAESGPPRPVKMPAYLEKSGNEIITMFNELEWKQRFRLFHAIENESSPYKVDRSPIVVSRNRYGNVQPWDASRIRLNTPIDGSDYVNASPIKLKPRVQHNVDSASKSYLDEISYIATQGPKQGQKSHFWHMVHQEVNGDVGVIVMLTQTIEDGKEKCAQYYPTELDKPDMILLHEDSSKASTDGANDTIIQAEKSIDIVQSDDDHREAGTRDTVTLISKVYDAKTRCDVRTFELVINGQKKTILHYLFGRWPDFGKPEAEDRKALIELSKQTYADAKGTPRIVHCSAGVGRTGTWIALDFLVREVNQGRLFEIDSSSEHATTQVTDKGGNMNEKEETWGRSGPPKINTPTLEDGFNKGELDPIFETVDQLREQRMMMVVREVQYSFLYDVIREAFLQKYGDQAQGLLLKDTEFIEIQSQPRKQPRIAAVTQNGDSDAETEIIDSSEAMTYTDNADGNGADDEDPYSAVSPDVLRRRAEIERSATSSSTARTSH